MVVAAAVQASDLAVQLPGASVPPSASNVLVLANSTADIRLPFPLGMEGESYVDLLKRADTVLAVSIVEVIPIGITSLEEWYANGTTPLLWYRVKCQVKAVIRGTSPSSPMQFVTCYGRHRHVWPYVKGFCYRLGMDNIERKWSIVAQVRTCPFPPYSLEDHVAFDDLKRGKSGIDLTRWETLIAERQKKSTTRCLDIAVEKNRYLMMTFAGQSLLGGLDVDYGRGVSVQAYSWTTGVQLDPTVLPELKEMGIEKLW